MKSLFADPKTDFVFKKLFGTEEHKPLLIALLNGLLELDEGARTHAAPATWWRCRCSTWRASRSASSSR